MELLNIFAAWIGITLGVVSGIPLGLFFHREDWLGGYGSWPRRLLRLGHVSFFGIGILNLSFAATVMMLQMHGASVEFPSRMFILAQVTMPLVCFLAAFWKPLRHLFFLPVASTLGGAVGTIWMIKAVVLP